MEELEGGLARGLFPTRESAEAAAAAASPVLIADGADRPDGR